MKNLFVWSSIYPTSFRGKSIKQIQALESTLCTNFPEAPYGCIWIHPYSALWSSSLRLLNYASGLWTTKAQSIFPLAWVISRPPGPSDCPAHALQWDWNYITADTENRRGAWSQWNMKALTGRFFPSIYEKWIFSVRAGNFQHFVLFTTLQ